MCLVPPGSFASPAGGGAGIDENDLLQLNLIVAEALSKPSREGSFSADAVGAPPAVTGGPKLPAPLRDTMG